jgi:predicted Zn-dependent protease with MMP-like domain
METEKFESIVAQAMESLPEEIRERLENITIMVADDVTPTQRRQNGLKKNETLLGLYEGVPLTERSVFSSFSMPDRITIFQKPIEEKCRTEGQILAEIKKVVRHEIAHHFGIDDDRLHEIGRY